MYDTLRRARAVRRLRPLALRLEPTGYAAGRLIGPEPFRSVARARHAALHRDWHAATSAWKRLLDGRERTHPTWHYEYARALDRIGDIERAAAARSAAVRNGSSNPHDFRRLAARATDEGDWDLAARAWERVAELSGAAEPVERAADAAFEFGDMARAEQLYRTALEHPSGPSETAYAGLINSIRKCGRLDDAEAVATEASRRCPTSSAVAAASAWVATERRDWAAARHRWPIAFTTRPGVAPPRWVFRYGEALEKLGSHHEAAPVYDLALARLATVDEPWAHWSLLEWEFRRDYCRHRTGELTTPTPDLEVEAAPPPGRDADPPANARTGWFAADVNHLGLRVHGALEGTEHDTVEVLVDDCPVKHVDVDRSTQVARFTFTIRHAALRSFPARSRLTVAVAGGHLCTRDGDGHVEVTVPGGDGTLLERLTTIEAFTKKGSLVPKHRTLVSPTQLLDAYTTLREAFATRFRRDLFLMYGTLLGCHRDGRFIPGDDDLDVGYLTECTDPQQLKHETRETVETLLAEGFDVTTRHGGALFKVWIDGIDIDVYPIWFYNGRAWGYDSIRATPDDFVPVEQREFLGTDVLVPRRPELLLAETYGLDWGVPQPGFRHYRSKHVLNVLARSALTPTESRSLLEQNRRARAEDETVGTFEMYDGGAR